MIKPLLCTFCMFYSMYATEGIVQKPGEIPSDIDIIMSEMTPKDAYQMKEKQEKLRTEIEEQQEKIRLNETFIGKSDRKLISLTQDERTQYQKAIDTQKQELGGLLEQKEIIDQRLSHPKIQELLQQYEENLAKSIQEARASRLDTISSLKGDLTLKIEDVGRDLRQNGITPENLAILETNHKRMLDELSEANLKAQFESKDAQGRKAFIEGKVSDVRNIQKVATERLKQVADELKQLDRKKGTYANRSEDELTTLRKNLENAQWYLRDIKIRSENAEFDLQEFNISQTTSFLRSMRRGFGKQVRAVADWVSNLFFGKRTQLDQTVQLENLKNELQETRNFFNSFAHIDEITKKLLQDYQSVPADKRDALKKSAQKTLQALEDFEILYAANKSLVAQTEGLLQNLDASVKNTLLAVKRDPNISFFEQLQNSWKPDPEKNKQGDWAVTDKSLRGVNQPIRFDDAYQLLGISEHATQEEIQNLGSIFGQKNSGRDVWNLLSHPISRAQYDAYLADSRALSELQRKFNNNESGGIEVYDVQGNLTPAGRSYLVNKGQLEKMAVSPQDVEAIKNIMMEATNDEIITSLSFLKDLEKNIQNLKNKLQTILQS